MKQRAYTKVWNRVPLFLQLMVLAALSTYIPATHALINDNHSMSRSFFYAGTLGLILFGLVTTVLSSNRLKNDNFGQLLSLLAIFITAPIYFAVPVHDAAQDTDFLNAYVDMVSAMTTTGVGLLGDIDQSNSTLVLWRAMVAWMGGLVIWISAAGILVPFGIDTFENNTINTSYSDKRTIPQSGDSRNKFVDSARLLTPTYTALTIILWILLVLVGEGSTIAVIHAMSIMSTSGISSVGGLENASTGIIGELLMAIFLLFALSRLTFSVNFATVQYIRIFKDPEFKLGLMILAITSILLTSQSLNYYVDISMANDVIQAMKLFWANIFTVLSFLTTTGFKSAEWSLAQSVSNLDPPGIILMGLALIGGGVATTAGGVKLFRVYILYLNGMREIERLIHPSSVANRTTGGWVINKNNAFVAWIFFMLFALSLAIITVLLSLLGINFQDSVLLTISMLSTTGPLIEVVSAGELRLIDLTTEVKILLAGVMILGRFETLVVIALIGTESWRR
ncbi:MAG: TrkH family potassium uptake protein [Aestuariivita sp.]|nr:TrkH family potassium uptake protein [Aestuariivita sp.]